MDGVVFIRFYEIRYSSSTPAVFDWVGEPFIRFAFGNIHESRTSENIADFHVPLLGLTVVASLAFVLDQSYFSEKVLRLLHPLFSYVETFRAKSGRCVYLVRLLDLRGVEIEEEEPLHVRASFAKHSKRVYRSPEDFVEYVIDSCVHALENYANKNPSGRKGNRQVSNFPEGIRPTRRTGGGLLPVYGRRWKCNFSFGGFIRTVSAMLCRFFILSILAFLCREIFSAQTVLVELFDACVRVVDGIVRRAYFSARQPFPYSKLDAKVLEGFLIDWLLRLWLLIQSHFREW